MRAILTYHSIDDSGSPISVSPGVFAEHVRWMSQRRVQILSLDDLLGGRANDTEHAVAITFDDGFANFTGAAARLADHGLPATVFVVTKHVGGTNTWGGRTDPGIPTLPLLGWPEIEHVVAGGVAVGAHTCTHAALTTLPSAAVEEEMDGCVEELRARLGASPTYFAYPYGAVNDRIAAIAARRFTGSVTTRFGLLSAGDPPMQLPRLDMYYFREPGAIERWATPRFARRLWSVRLRRRLRAVLK